MKHTLKKSQKGFTLIELMIVVAVIGVLASIAIPQYQTYVAKSEVASALATMTGVKTNVEAHAVENGAFPAAKTETDLGVPAAIKSGAIVFVPGSNGAGKIQYTFNAKVSQSIANKVFELNRSDAGAWTCTATAKTPVEAKYLPKNCK